MGVMQGVGRIRLRPVRPVCHHCVVITNHVTLNAPVLSRDNTTQSKNALRDTNGSDMPHRSRVRIVQSYSPGVPACAPSNTQFCGPARITTSQSVQPFLQGHQYASNIHRQLWCRQRYYMGRLKVLPDVKMEDVKIGHVTFCFFLHFQRNLIPKHGGWIVENSRPKPMKKFYINKKDVLSQRWPRDAPYIYECPESFWMCIENLKCVALAIPE